MSPFLEIFRRLSEPDPHKRVRKLVRIKRKNCEDISNADGASFGLRSPEYPETPPGATIQGLPRPRINFNSTASELIILKAKNGVKGGETCKCFHFPHFK
jgi:hypothetical protein